MIKPAALVEARNAKKWSQPVLAREAGCSQQLIAALEKGTTKSTKFLPKIASALEVDPGLLDSDWINMRGIQPLPPEKIEGPKRTPVNFYVKEWRKFCEEPPGVIAKELRIDTGDYGYLESRPYKFSIEQLVTIAATLKIQFDSMRWNPEKLPVPQPAKSDVERINKARGRK